MSLSFQGHTTGDPKRPLSVILSRDVISEILLSVSQAPNLGEDWFWQNPPQRYGEGREEAERRLKYISLCTSKSP